MTNILPILGSAMVELPIAGGCYCGAIRYRIDAEPKRRPICYCANCRQAVGSHSVSWVTVDEAAVSFDGGAPARYRTDTEAWRTFCGTCGTSLTYQHDDQQAEGTIDLTTGSLDHPERFPPRQTAWTAERLSWERLADVGVDR